MTRELLEQYNEIPNASIRAWKDQGKKVIGFMCSYLPEEIIHAAGMLPFRIRGTGCTKMNCSDALMSNYSCSFARSCLEFVMDGTYGFLDGVIALDSCSQMVRLYDNWRFRSKLPFMHLLHIPYKNSDTGIDWFRSEIAVMIKALEKTFRVTITDENLLKAIRVYNETRMLLGSLYELRKGENPPITGSQGLSIALAATSMPREQYNELLKAFLQEMRPGESTTRDPRARLMLIGGSLDDPSFIKIIEDQGGLVVIDAMCFGGRYFSEPVDENGDPLLSLAKSYLNRPKCPRMMNEHVSLFEFIMDMVQKYKVEGVIFQKMRFCSFWGGESLFLEKKLKDSGIPVLSIEREQILTNEAQIATRVEAFIEMIQGLA